MRTALTTLTIAVATLMAWPTSAGAQPNATLILASGDRISGQLVDLNASGFEVSVNGETRSLPRSDVAVIDFVGGNIPASEISRMEGGRTLVFMRGGDFFYGTLYDLSQRDPLLITVQTPDGERQVMSNQVGRIYLRTWQGMPARDDGGNAQAGGRGGAVQPPDGTVTGRYTLNASQQWINTRLMVRQGQMVSFNVAGEIQLSGDGEDIARPAGSVRGRPGGRGAPLPATSAGAFIGRIGTNGRPFGIGDQTHPIPMPETGILWIGINDNTMGNNSGQYTVDVRVQ